MARAQNIELLRVVLMLLVVVEHVYGHGCGIIRKIFESSNQSPDIPMSHILIYTPCIMAVDCFVLISGYYGISFKINKIFSLWVQAITTSILLLLGYMLWNTPNIKLIFGSCFPIISNYWWFLSTYILLVIVSPFLNSFYAIKNEKLQQIIIVGFFVLNCIGGLIWGTFNTDRGYSLFNFAFIYVLGRYIRKKEKNVNQSGIIYLIIWIVISCSQSLILFNVQDSGAAVFFTLLAYNNPIIILCAVLFFLIFKSIRLNINIYIVSKYALGIYLFHDNLIIRPLISRWVMMDNNIWNLSLAVIIFLIALIFESLRQNLVRITNVTSHIDSYISKMKLRINSK